MGTHMIREDIAPHMANWRRRLLQLPQRRRRKGHYQSDRCEFDELCVKGARWALGRGYARPEDLQRTEESGCLAGPTLTKSAAALASVAAPRWGRWAQAITLSKWTRSPKSMTKRPRARWACSKGQVALQIHCAHAGLVIRYVLTIGRVPGGDKKVRHQAARPRAGVRAVQFARRPEYFAAMACAANYAFANRQVLLHHIRAAWNKRWLAR